jgi:hypothetical protein
MDKDRYINGHGQGHERTGIVTQTDRDRDTNGQGHGQRYGHKQLQQTYYKKKKIGKRSVFKNSTKLNVKR